ncbi:uncharacterized protein LOC127727234 [Mytilus californianus]|uniref:uncharacterized protein LOC127727234 n=1 Tax=Mytilus californianus TaxID=6549 RepID=UPI002247E7C1|nr:uncharacterized protein LOC127727234 [Mytilus californianus]
MTLTYTNMDDTDYWNAYFMRLYIPLDILLILFIITGVTGNGLVAYIYGFKKKTIKDGQYFLPYLAVADLLGSIICSLNGLAMTLMPLTNEFDLLCKFGGLLGSAIICMSACLLIMIAIQRYLKVCRRKGPVMTLKRRKAIMICALFVSAVLAGPSMVAYGSIPLQSINRNVTGKICGKITGTVSAIYDVVLGVAYILFCGLLIVPYCLIARKTCTHLKKGVQSDLESQKRSKNENYENQTQGYSISTLDTELKPDYSISVPSNTQQSNQIIVDLENNSLRNYSKVIKKQSKTNQRIISKVTKISLIITLTFLIGSLPKIILTIAEIVPTTFWENATDVEILVLMFVNQGYILNYIANPFIYTFFDKTFKTEIKNILCCCICTKKR